MTNLPADLLYTVSQGRGRIVLVLGAGCSVEEPTGLDTSPKCARAVHDRLVADSVIEPGECNDPERLEAVADLVVSKSQGSKAELIKRLPRNRFRFAKPNLGHQILAALIAEEIVGRVLTVNFDLAINNAIQSSGLTEVGILRGPYDHGEFGSAAIVYLHGNADSPDNEWLVTTDEVENGWRERWGEAVSQASLSVPVVVFVGVGTLVGALLTSVYKVKEAIPDHIAVYLVDPIPIEDSTVFPALNAPRENYIETGWCDFAERIADRVNESHLTSLTEACENLSPESDEGRFDPSAYVAALRRMGMLGFGKLRAAWFLYDGDYYSWRETLPRWVAELLATVELVRAELAAEFGLAADGAVEFFDGRVRVGVIGCFHGRAAMRWSELLSRVQVGRQVRFESQSRVDGFIVAGVEGLLPEALSTPPDVVGGRGEYDIIAGQVDPPLVPLSAVRDDPSTLTGLMSNG